MKKSLHLMLRKCFISVFLLVFLSYGIETLCIEYRDTIENDGQLNSVLLADDGSHIMAGELSDSGWIVKVNSARERVWEAKYGGTDLNKFQKIIKTSDNSYLFIGSDKSSNPGIENGWIVKIDSLGAKLWEKTFGGDSHDWLVDGIETSDDGFLLIGTTFSYGKNGFDDHSSDGWIVKVDSVGNKLWERTFGGNTSYRLRSAAFSDNGGFLLAGDKVPNGSNYDDGLIIKVDSLGVPIWEKAFSPTLYNDGFNKILSVSDGYLLTGNSNLGPTTGSDGWLLKINTSGDEQWEEFFNYSDYDCIYDIIPSTDNRYLLTGTSNPTGLNNNGLIIEIDSLGTKNWESVIDDNNKSRNYYSIAPFQDSGYLIVGDNIVKLNYNEAKIIKPEMNSSIIDSSTIDITWDYMFNVNTVNLEYSINNGLNWITIALNTENDRIYKWNVPNIAPSNCLIRLTSEENSLLVDTVNISLTNGTITVNLPNGSESIKGGTLTTFPIRWSSDGIIGTVKIEYSIDNITWHEIINSTENDGHFYWSVPDANSATCKVRITSNEDSNINDSSDDYFTIIPLPKINILAPNGYEKLMVDSTYNIIWTSENISDSVTIEYSLNNGTNWNTIDSNTNNDGIFEWTIPNDTSTYCLIRIFEFGDELLADTSDDCFIIQFNNVPTVVSPIPDLTIDEDASTIVNYVDCRSVFNDAEDLSVLKYTVFNNSNSLLVDVSINSDSGIDISFLSNQFGTASIIMQAEDIDNNIVQDTFNVIVNSVNDTPIAIVDTIKVNQGEAISVLINGSNSVLNNDTDIDFEDNLTSSIYESTSNGNIILNSDGTFEYTHDGSNNFTDQFSYFAIDDAGDKDTAFVYIIIDPKTPINIKDSNSEIKSFSLYAIPNVIESNEDLSFFINGRFDNVNIQAFIYDALGNEIYFKEFSVPSSRDKSEYHAFGEWKMRASLDRLVKNQSLLILFKVYKMDGTYLGIEKCFIGVK